jgi:hypothetical protein
MAKIPDGTFKDWQDNQVIHATEYKQEREIIRTAVNDNNDRLTAFEEIAGGLETDSVQMSKITSDDGKVKLAITDTGGDILASLVGLGLGFHTFYAVSGSQNLPPTNKSIRGVAEITGVNPTYGYVWATDFNNNIFHNYIDNDVWKGWKSEVAVGSGAASSLNSMITSGFFWVDPGTTNAPTTNAGNLIVIAAEDSLTSITQIFIDMSTGVAYRRTKFNVSWGGWIGDGQDELWSGASYMNGGQAPIFPSKKLSQCKTGWMLCFSDYDSDTNTTNDSDFNYYHIPKYHALKFSGKSVLAPIVNFLSGTLVKTTSKRLFVYDDHILGSDDNQSPSTDTNDVVLRAVIEY